MAARRTRNRGSAEHPHDFFISMTDMMVGMIFLFIIMLMFFALKLERTATQGAGLIASLTTTEEIRAHILTELGEDMARKGITVQLTAQDGVLSLPENILFDKGRAELSRRGEEAIAILAKSLYDNLLCYTTPAAGDTAKECPETMHSVEAVLIEGHTDSDGNDVANWNLSVKRSFNAYQSLMGANPELSRLTNRNGQAIFSIAGYGKQRPIRSNDSDENKHKNRRVDLRLIMVPPVATDVRLTP